MVAVEHATADEATILPRNGLCPWPAPASLPRPREAGPAPRLIPPRRGAPITEAGLDPAPAGALEGDRVMTTLQDIAPQPARVSTTAPEGAPSPATKPVRVAVVDDDDDFRRALSFHLVDQGLETITYSDGRSALE